MEKLIIFDCDGTIVDSEIIAARVFPEVWGAMGVEMTSDYFICNFVGVGGDADVVKATMARLPERAMEIADQKFFQALEAGLLPVEGMSDLLESIAHKKCVASNSSLPYVENALRWTGLDRFFDGQVFSATQVAKPKPAPDLFLHTARTMGFAPEQCLVIEDSFSGVMGAKNAGMKVVGFTGGRHFNEVVKSRLLAASPDFVCSSTSELSYLINAI